MDNQANIVIDVPEGTGPEETSRLLNAPGEAYFLVQVLPIGGGHRAYLRRYKQTAPTKAEAVKDHLDDATAMSILRANRDESVRTIVDLLAKAGIKRGKQWVCDQLDATCAEDGKEEAALAHVKKWAGNAAWGPKAVVVELQYVYKIKRSTAWARQKLEDFRTAVRADNS